MTHRSTFLLPVSLLLAGAVLALATACRPSISREMLTPSPTVSSTPRPTNTPDPRLPAATPTPTGRPQLLPAMSVFGDLLLVQYPVGPAEGYDLRPGSAEQNQDFYRRLPAGIFEENAARWKPESGPLVLDALNVALAPTGYRLEKEPAGQTFRLFRASKLEAEGINGWGTLAWNRSGSDFLLSLYRGSDEAWILQKAGLEPWYAGTPRPLPIFAGDARVELSQPGEFTWEGEQVSGVQVLRGGQPEAVLPLPYQGPNLCPLERFRAWDERWVLEAEGEVWVDGQALTGQYGYEQVFNWHLLGGQEFFLFEQDGSFGIYAGGKELPVRFDEIVHWTCVDQQGSTGYNLSARGNDRIAAFFAQKDGQWFYNEVVPIE